MDNEIILYKNKTNKKYNDTIDFILNQAILKGWRLTFDTANVLKNNIIITLKLNNDIIEISADDFVFSLCFHNKIHINHLEIQKYCLKRGVK